MIPTLQRNAMLIPQKATFEIQDMKFCYVVGDSSKGSLHSYPDIRPERRRNYIVTGGLKPGDQVVVEGVGISVKDGMQIKPKK